MSEDLKTLERLNAAAGRYTDIWQKQGGRWLCVAAHVTRG